jgi:hypothetical protein
LGAERGLGDVAALGRLAEVKGIGDGNRVLKLAQGEIGRSHGDSYNLSQR